MRSSRQFLFNFLQSISEDLEVHLEFQHRIVKSRQALKRWFEDVSEALTETMVSPREGEIFKVNNTRQLTQESSGRKEDQGSEVQLII